jgi:hypothetical protein
LAGPGGYWQSGFAATLGRKFIGKFGNQLTRPGEQLKKENELAKTCCSFFVKNSVYFFKYILVELHTLIKEPDTSINIKKHNNDQTSNHRKPWKRLYS